MKNSNLIIAAVRSVVPVCSAVVLGAALAGCGEDPILLAEIIGSSQQPSGAASPSEPVAGEPPRIDPPEVPAPLPDDGPFAPPPGEPVTQPGEPDPNAPPPTAGEPSPPGAFNPFEAPAFEILIRYCGACHDDAPDRGQGDFNDIADLDRMLERGLIIAGSKEDSAIYTRMLDGSMPPVYVSDSSPTVEEIELVGSFIDALAGTESD